ncbi:PREDICTED: nuclear pore membrane glycoprotein 210 [Ceratosolen solmsi marchali]|uniref:Nuclear pore membrane glycoprotein 210 n=1 Tax=Ceratosolen solmsi marchali TaxID=326594 RepID=A0AAJ6YLF4_9HYME|nr:PREDICTED: nuclear pore membrane glycoprotein 210 [Ceratosolen solmsi marchali]
MAGLQKLLKIFCITALCVLVFVFPFVVADRLNVPRVLLPVFNDNPVNFTLEVTHGGCYQWSTSRPDIIRLIPINEDYDNTCSIEVVVQTVTRDPTRKTAIVLAEDVVTGNFLRCDVIVDAIFSLNIVTTTRELFIEEAPEAFEVRAYDEQGNEFTTLSGIEFSWEIRNIDKKGVQSNSFPNNVLRFITFQESPYETPSSIEMLDAIGKTGNIILLEGIKTGTAKVAVKILYPEYRHVPPVEVELIVVANLIIIPSDVTMMSFDSFKYRVVQVHQGRLEEINIPLSQYYLEAENPEILEINNAKANAYALMDGKSKVLLHDKNVHEEYGVILPTATVNVKEVASISISVLPHRNRFLILGFTHEIIVEMFDRDDYKFYIGEGVEMTTKINDKYFDTKFTTRNGTHVVVVPTATGTTEVEATLHGVINQKGERIPIYPKLTSNTELTIQSAVTIHPRMLALPWDPKVKTRYDVALKASGGDGSYVWNSRQPSIVSVSQSGALKILQKGTADITVSLFQNGNNRDTAKLHVLEPKKLEIIQYNMEAAVGEVIHLHIALFGESYDGSEFRLIPFNDCQDLFFEVDIPDGNFIAIESEAVEPVSIACATISIVSQIIGVSKVSVTYGRNLTDNITVSAYEPLIVVHPVKAETVLSVGSSRNIIFKGGPQAWSEIKRDYQREVSISDESILEVVEQESSYEAEISIFKVLCKALGESYLTFSVYNTPILPSCKVGEAVANVKVICGRPRFIYLQPEFRDGKNCPINQNTERIVTHSEETLRLIVIVKDEEGRRFDNITSLNIDWSIKPFGNAIIDVSIGSLEESHYEYQVLLPKHHYQQITPKKYTDSLILKAKITGYQKNILSRFRITPEYPPFPIESENGIIATPSIEANVNIFLVNDTVIVPGSLKILNDPNSKYYLQVNQGSGYYDLVLSNEEVADVRYVEPTRTISIVPRKSGMLTVALLDLCLSSKAAEVDIEVQQLASLEIESVNKVEKGKYITAHLRLYDTNGFLMMLPALDMLDIKVEIENGFIDVKRVPTKEQANPPFDKVLLLIYGLEEGETQVVFSSRQGTNEVRSETIIIQVFPPLRVLPKNLTTLVGTIYQISIVGGPKNVEIEFSTENDEILEIENTGVIEGKATGQTTIYAKSVGEDSMGKKVIFSQDSAEVRVILLEGVKVIVPTLKVKVGAVIPVWIFGIPDHLTPLIIGSMKSPLVFSWSMSDSNIMSLHSMYERTGINIRYQNEVTLRAKANKAGVATISLIVTTPCNVPGGCRIQPSFSSSVKIEIFEELRLTNEGATSESLVLLMAPNSSMKLQTNRDKFGLTTYKIINAQIGGDTDDPNALASLSSIITIDKNGLLRSGEHYGSGIVSVTNSEAYSTKQTLMITVYIKPIHYVMLSLKSNVRIRNDEELTMLPKGMDLNYVLEYFDSIGSKFHAADVDFRTLSSRTDLVTFTENEKNILNAKFLENGELVVKIYNEKYPNGMFDYVHMLIGDVLFPTKTHITVGDVVCFSMPFLSPDGDPGFWQSSAPEVLQVDPLIGIGKARSSGTANVKHSIATHLRDEVEITVSPIAKITLIPQKGKNVTGTEVFSIPLILKGKHEMVKENNVISRGLTGCRTLSSFSLSHPPFVCTIQLSPLHSVISIKDLFYAKQRFDIVTGFYYCDIIPMGLPSIISSTLETKLRINALSRDIESMPVEVPYLPPMYISTREIIFLSSLGQEIPTANLDIYGLPYVLKHIIIEAPEEVSVGARQFISKNVAQFKLSLTQNEDEVQGHKIIITNELIKQNISLLIRVPKYNQFPRISGIHWVDYMYFHRYTLGTLVILSISFFHFWKNKITNVDMSVKNKNVFAEKCSPPVKKATPCSTLFNNVSGSSSPGNPVSPFRPFSAFEPVYGDPRGFFTPNTRRNRT